MAKYERTWTLFSFFYNFFSYLSLGYWCVEIMNILTERKYIIKYLYNIIYI